MAKVGDKVPSATLRMLGPEGPKAVTTEELFAPGKKVVLDRAVDPTLLGGVVTRIGDRVIDGSIRSRLDALKTSLLQP